MPHLPLRWGRCAESCTCAFVYGSALANNTHRAAYRWPPSNQTKVNVNTEHRDTATLLDLYYETGPFLWSQHLKELGSTSPVRTVFIIGKCLSGEFAARSGWHAVERSQPQDALQHVLGQAYALFAEAPIEPLVDIDTRTGKLGRWDAHGVLAELMAVDLGPHAIRSARHRFRNAGISVGFPELHDLSAVFANVHLRGALKTFDALKGEGREAAWLSTVFYRYALRHVMANRRLEDVLPLSDELPDLASEPQDVLERQAHEAVLQALPKTLAALPRMQREAVSLYFGFEGREQTIAEVAAALSTNVYFARTALISGLGAIAASTGAAGMLDKRELMLARSVFLEGRSIEHVAETSSLGQAEVRRQIAQVTGKLQGALRRRTTVPRVHSINREFPMTSKEREYGLRTDELRQYVSTATLSFQGSSARAVDWSRHFSTSFVPVAVVRELLSRQPELLKELSDRSEEVMSELYAPQPEELDRPDLDNDHRAWQEALDFAASQTLDDMRPLLSLWEERARESKIAVEATSEEQMLERLRDSLAAVATGLEQGLPRRARRDRSLLLAFWFPDAVDQVSVRWTTDAWTGDAIPLFALTRHRLGFVGGFKSNVADLFARCAVQILQERSSPLLPGFSFADRQPKRAGDVFLSWSAPAPVEVEIEVDEERDRERRRSDRE